MASLASTIIPSHLLPAPPQGIYPNVPSEIYHRWECVNNTRLSWLNAGTPASMRAKIFDPPKSTPALKLGSAIHAAFLQPDLFEKEYLVATGCVEKTGKGTNCSRNGSVYRNGKWYCGQHDPLNGAAVEHGKIVLPQDDFDLCLRMRDAAWAHPGVRDLMKDAQVELSTVAVDGIGLTRKCRFDVLPVAAPWLVDVKSTDAESEEDYQWSLYHCGYHRQAWSYLDQAERLGHRRDDFVHLVLPKNPPHIPALIPIGKLSIEKGRDEVERLSKLYKRCQDAGVWPGLRWNWGDDGKPQRYVIRPMELPERILREAIHEQHRISIW